jgi:hypothetical protein
LVYAWVLSPVEYVDADPSLLRSDFKDSFRSVVAASYAATGDLQRARARLALLGDADAAAALAAQAQQMLAVGSELTLVQQVAQLGADLQAGPGTPAAVQTPTGRASPTAQPSAPPVGASIQTTTPTPVTIETPTPRPTTTPTITPGAGFVLVGQEAVCELGGQAPTLQIVVTDAAGRQVPGTELIVTWDGGEDHFFTGFKPELGNGFADFVMTPGMSYTVRVGAGGLPVSNVSAPPCQASNSNSFTGGLRLTFRQP